MSCGELRLLTWAFLLVTIHTQSAWGFRTLGLRSNKSGDTELKCCCDTDLGLEGQRCQYVEEKWFGGGCPVADLGRGSSQTHSVLRQEGKTKLCELTDSGRAAIEEAPISNSRALCIMEEHAEATVFPPEQYANWSWQLKIPKVPKIGDLHVAVEEIHVMHIGMVVKWFRKSKDIFSFSVTGLDGRSPAVIQAFIRNVVIVTPDISVDTVLNAATMFQNVLANVVTLGGAGKDWGRPDTTPVDLTINLSGDFKRVRKHEGWEWEIVRSSAEHRAKLALGSGGLINAVINLAIHGFGGLDTVFFDAVFPLIQLLIPVGMGEAFEQVEYGSGKVENTVTVNASCTKPEGERCPMQELFANVTLEDKLNVLPAPIVTDLSKNGYVESLIRDGYLGPDNFLAPMLQSLAAAYASGDNVFGGVTAASGIDLSINQDWINISGVPSVELPLALFEGVLPPLVSDAVLNFIPGGGKATTFRGTAALDAGVLSAKDMTITDLQIPVGADKNNFIHFGIDIDDFTAELEDAGEEDESLLALAFGPGAPLQAGSGAEVTLSEAGLQVSPLLDEGAGITASVQRDRVAGFLSAVTQKLIQPANTRTATPLSADGVVPPQHQRPFARQRTGLDLDRLIKDLVYGVEVKADSANGIEGSWGESLNVTIVSHVTGTLGLGKNLWEQLLDSKSKDLGYLHSIVPGFVGYLGSSGDPPGQKALAVLSCGRLSIYKVSASSFMDPAKVFKQDSEPDAYSHDVAYSIDLRTAGAELLISRFAKRGVECLSVAGPSALSFFRTGSPVYFCGVDAASAHSLVDAVGIQKARLVDASSRWRSACVPGPGGGAPVCQSSPDGSWFKELSPYDPTTWFPGRAPPRPQDVLTPRQGWNNAVARLVGKG